MDNDIKDNLDPSNVASPETYDDDSLSGNILINAAKSSKSKLPPGDIPRVLSKSSTRSINMANIVFNASASRTSGSHDLSLVDRGANGGLAGDDVRVIFKTNRTVNIRGIDNHRLTNIDIGTVGGVVDTHKGPVIAIMHQYALLGKGHSIHSPCQIEHFKNQVNDKSIHVGGSQSIKTLDGYAIPLIIKDGLVRMQIRPYTDAEYDSLPHVFLTHENTWDPSILDSDVPDKEKWFDCIADMEPDPNSTRFDEFGDYYYRVTIQHAAFFHRHDSDDIEDVVDRCVYHSQMSYSTNSMVIFYDAHEHEIDNEDRSSWIRALLLISHLTSHCFVLSLAGYPRTLSSKHLVAPPSMLAFRPVHY